MPFAGLEAEVRERARASSHRMPLSQLAAMKLVVNQAYENMGLASTQMLGPILDGLMRNTPEAKASSSSPEREGVPAVVARARRRVRRLQPGAAGGPAESGERDRGREPPGLTNCRYRAGGVHEKISSSSSTAEANAGGL